jgi:G3E family GTPase
VIINEFGEIGLDHLLVKPIREGVVLLQSGCLCCTLRGDLVDALEQLLRDLDNGRATFRRVVLETTGLADPVPVLQTTMAHPYLVMRYRLDGVIAVVDAVNGAATLDEHMEAVKQVAVADRIVLTKDRSPHHAGTSARPRRPRCPAARAQSGRAHPRCRSERSIARSPPGLRPVRPRPQDSRRQALARGRSLCRRGRRS